MEGEMLEKAKMVQTALDSGRASVSVTSSWMQQVLDYVVDLEDRIEELEGEKTSLEEDLTVEAVAYTSLAEFIDKVVE